MTYEGFVGLLEGVEQHLGYVMARCPAHDDQHQSLQVSEREDGSIGVFCQGNCETENVVAAMGLKMRDLFPGIDWDNPEATYVYEDEFRRPIFEKIRYPGKQFLIKRYVGGQKENGMGESRRVLYKLPDVLAADPNRYVFICEGEKDVDAVWQAGGVATCNFDGAGNWLPDYTAVLAGRHVRIVADQDDPGRKHASNIFFSLRPVAASVEIVHSKAGKDAYDHIEAGFKLEDWAKPSRFKPLDLTIAPPQVEWLLEGYIALGDVVLLSGTAGLGKSFWTMGLTKCVADGDIEFLERSVQTHGRVLYADEENPEDVVYTRLKKLGLIHDENVRYLWNQGIRLDKRHDIFMEEVIEYQPKLVVLDSLTRFHSLDENAVGEIGGLLNDVVKPLARDTGAAVIVIHHHNKSDKTYRGSSDIGASVDARIEMFPVHGEEGKFVQRLAKSRRQLTGDKRMVQIQDIPGGIVRLNSWEIG